ncbi:MAG TPA: hypothetical protein DEA55_05910 [Rhodospirillaceae bacterium]|nr:hypothetical protein [Rhodospirillaceae bacterium]
MGQGLISEFGYNPATAVPPIAIDFRDAYAGSEPDFTPSDYLDREDAALMIKSFHLAAEVEREAKSLDMEEFGRVSLMAKNDPVGFHTKGGKANLLRKGGTLVRKAEEIGTPQINEIRRLAFRYANIGGRFAAGRGRSVESDTDSFELTH